jgi:signal transduction histidine kinase
MAMSKILVIDDEPGLRELIRTALELKGFEVLEAADHLDGDAKARQHLPDLILCDINMLGKSDAGYDALKKLRKDAATAAIPIILMTGMADTAGMRRGMGEGADDYLFKPFKVDELYATVDARLRNARTVRAEAEKKLALLRSQISLMMPHEMRTPLNGIMAYGELLRTDAASFKPEEIAEMGQVIAESGHRLHRLIEKFHIYAQLEIAASDPEIISSFRAAKNTRAADLARDEAIAQATQAARSADLSLELADAPLAMSEDCFRRIVAELVQNAFKFSKPGKRVRVTLAPAGKQIDLSVQDEGCGFTPDQTRRIDAYLQFDRKMEDRQGLGLGLAIAMKLVELHQGSFAVTSTPGAGSSITVKLPLAA